jgi:2-polyprenyl-3-methyl-5-hydroxy-6-metoxy-1,4-benzoquinol methylase
MAETLSEAEWIDAVDAKVLGASQVSLNEVASYASYRRLHLAPWAAMLPRQGWPAPFDALIRLALLEPLAEAELRPTIRQLGDAIQGVSATVQAQYEENPYPRWVSMSPAPPDPLPSTIRRLHPNADLRSLRWQPEPDILVASCGTGRQAIEIAQRHPAAIVTAIDLSMASLSFAKRKAIEAGVSNIEFAQADLTTVDFGDRRFNLIESSGVLHHLEHPVDGWRRLVDMLRPGGAMTIALYSRAARAWLADLRDKYGVRGDADDIRAFRQDLMAREPEHPVLGMDDFYSLSECRDLVFHVQETQFDLPEIGSILADLGLRLIGLIMPPEQMAAYDARFPSDPERTNLKNWAALEAEQPTMFIGMYQFWVVKAP